jgi:hypothetical protein
VISGASAREHLDSVAAFAVRIESHAFEAGGAERHVFRVQAHRTRDANRSLVRVVFDEQREQAHPEMI